MARYIATFPMPLKIDSPHDRSTDASLGLLLAVLKLNRVDEPVRFHEAADLPNTTFSGKNTTQSLLIHSVATMAESSKKNGVKDFANVYNVLDRQGCEAARQQFQLPWE
ncbi:hypothetical protein HK102_001837 [Quaeritorhiza haematococci]|nr:hypothetical protein HK102_001837 [Quaeritorhiza haematococci]